MINKKSPQLWDHGYGEEPLRTFHVKLLPRTGSTFYDHQLLSSRKEEGFDQKSITRKIAHALQNTQGIQLNEASGDISSHPLLFGRVCVDELDGGSVEVNNITNHIIRAISEVGEEALACMVDIEVMECHNKIRPNGEISLGKIEGKNLSL